MHVRWLTAFLDTPRAAPHAVDVVPFWEQVTASRLSPRRGVEGQFATLQPVDGDAYLRVQDTDTGEPGCHLDLHVDDVRGALDAVRRCGAMIEVDLGKLVIARSPGGLVFCLVSHHGESRRPAPTAATGRSSRQSLVDQLCIDVAPEPFDAEVAWWSDVLSWRARRGSEPQFVYLERPQHMPLRLLFQRLDDPTARDATAHLDIACTDRAAEVARHVQLGASVRRETEQWTTLADPVGRNYCLTDRDPVTGRSGSV